MLSSVGNLSNLNNIVHLFNTQIEKKVEKKKNVRNPQITNVCNLEFFQLGRSSAHVHDYLIAPQEFGTEWTN